jgi:carbonic anhydrase
MSVIDDVLSANQRFAETFHPRHFVPSPRLHLAVLTCMDTRLTIASLGLRDGDAHMIRNAGGLITEDSLRSIIISHHLLGTRELMIINHTDCGLMKFGEQEIREHVRTAAGRDADTPSCFHSFKDVEANVADQLRRFREHPWVGDLMPARGFVYDVATGKLNEVK